MAHTTAATPLPPAAQPQLLRPAVSDVTFDYKSGRTPQGWPLESIKAGGVPGLTAYACFYACRAARPELMGGNQARIGLDPDFCAVFWSQLPDFTSVPAVVDAMLARLRPAAAATADAAAAAQPLPDRNVALTLLDGLAWALEPTRQVALWLHATALVELLAGADRVAAAVGAHLSALPGGPTATEVQAMEGLRVARERAGAAVDALVAGGGLAWSAPRVDVVLDALYGLEPAVDGVPPLSPPPRVVTDDDTRVTGLWDVPFEALAAAWTHTDAALFRSIPVAEWRDAGWDRPRYEHAADGVRRFIEHYNATALWVTAEVLLHDTPAARAAAIVRFLQVLSTLRRLCNFSGLFAVVSGLRRGAVARLGHTWALLPRAASDRWRDHLALAGELMGWGWGACVVGVARQPRRVRAAVEGVRCALPTLTALTTHVTTHHTTPQTTGAAT